MQPLRDARCYVGRDSGTKEVLVEAAPRMLVPVGRGGRDRGLDS